jgi:hypothetical protein
LRDYDFRRFGLFNRVLRQPAAESVLISSRCSKTHFDA